MDELYATITSPDMPMWTPWLIVGVAIVLACVIIGGGIALLERDPVPLVIGLFFGAILGVGTIPASMDRGEREVIGTALAQYVQDHYDVVPVEHATLTYPGAHFRALNDDGDVVYVTATWDDEQYKPIVKGTELPTVRRPVTFTIDTTEPADW